MAPTRPKPATIAEPKPAPEDRTSFQGSPSQGGTGESCQGASTRTESGFRSPLGGIDRATNPAVSSSEARRPDPLANPRFSDDTFRFVKLRVAEAYRPRVEEIQGWCDERRMLGRQARMHHWLHGWLFVHVPLSFLLILLTAWHAFVTLFRY